MTKSNIFECRYIVYNTHEKKNKRKRGDLAMAERTRGLARSRKIRNTVSGWGFIAPLFLFFLVFTAIPVLVTLGYLCFTKYNIMTNPSWIRQFSKNVEGSIDPTGCLERSSVAAVFGSSACDFQLADGLRRVSHSEQIF